MPLHHTLRIRGDLARIYRDGIRLWGDTPALNHFRVVPKRPEVSPCEILHISVRESVVAVIAPALLLMSYVLVLWDY